MNSSDPIQQKTWVKQIMNNSIVSVDSSVTATNAAKMMEDTGVGAIVVLENNIPVGIITDRDFAIKITAHAYPIDTPVRRIMSSPLITIKPDSTFWNAANLMNSRKIRKLPVVDDEQIVGIITVTDLMNHFVMHVTDEPN
jgi:CBS domain-containing protein